MPTVRLTWTDLNNGPAQEDEIRVYRSLTPFDEGSLPSVLATLDPDSVTYDDTTVADDTSYYYAVAAVKGSFLAIDFTGEVEVGAPAPGAGAIEYFLAKNATTQSHTAAATTALVFGTEVYDTFSVFSSNQFTVPAGMNGYYALLTASINFSGASDEDYLSIQRSTDGGSSWTSIAQIASDFQTGQSLITNVALVTGDQFRVIFNSDTARTISFSDLVNFSGIILEPVP